MLRDPVSDWTVPSSRSCENSNVCQGCTNSGCQVSMATTFCTVVTNICWCSVLELPSGAENFKMDLGFLENFSASSNNVRSSQDTVAVAICQFRAHNALYSAVGRVGYVVEKFGGLRFHLRTVLSVGCGRGYSSTHS
jgi:hypothetical protein